MSSPPYSDIYPNNEDRLLPVKGRLESFWLTERDLTLQHERTTPELPLTADIIVVGSGLAGAMMVYKLQNEAADAGKSLRIVMLEADEVCSGATARNGGHCKPMTIFGYRASAAKHGADVANHLLYFESDALEQYRQIVEKERIDCDLHITRAVDVCFDPADAEDGKKDYAARSEDWPETIKRLDVRGIDDPEDLEKISGVKGGHWGASYPAGHLWPYKLATSLLRICRSKGLEIQSHTPALSLSPSTSTPNHWTIKTSRGDITAPSIVVTTNAYTSGFLPEFRDLVVPVRGTVCSITPSPSHSPGAHPGPLKYTYGFRYAPGDIDYMICRQGRGQTPGHGDRSIILGGAKSAFLKDIDHWYNRKEDSQEMQGARNYFEEHSRKYLVGWDGDKENLDRVWTGVLGYSSDLIPYVGEIPGRSGVFVAAGFTGHGMPRIPGCTTSLSKLVFSSIMEGRITSKAEKSFQRALPKPYWLTKERYESRVNLILDSMGQ